MIIQRIHRSYYLRSTALRSWSSSEIKIRSQGIPPREIELAGVERRGTARSFGSQRFLLLLLKELDILDLLLDHLGLVRLYPLNLYPHARKLRESFILLAAQLNTLFLYPFPLGNVQGKQLAIVATANTLDVGKSKTGPGPSILAPTWPRGSPRLPGPGPLCSGLQLRILFQGLAPGTAPRAALRIT